MQNPFPGMNPFLERYWGDAHSTLITYSRDRLNEHLPVGLKARSQEAVAVQAESIERWLEIIDLEAQERIVTTIEVLSPANKKSPGKEAFKQKQHECIQQGINLVEIDLIRGGEFVLSVPESEVPDDDCRPYRICIRRLRRPAIAEVYRATFREPLPNIPIPLRPRDRNVIVTLQSLIDDVIRKGRYSNINYQLRLTDPPLSANDERWVDDLLRQAGLRT